MKKLLALVLVLMLMMASVAFAETANVTTFSNFKLLVSTPDGAQTMDLSDLVASVAMGMPEGVPTIQLDVASDTEALLGSEIQFIDGNMVLNVDGMSRPIAASMNNEQAQQMLEEMFSKAEAMSNVKMPAFKGTTIPKLPLMDVTGLLPMLGIEPVVDGQTATFEIPAEFVSTILQMIVAQLPEQTKSMLGGLDQALANQQFGINGKISDDGTTAELLLDLVPEQNGVAGEPFAGLYIASSENSDSLEVLVYQEGQSITLAKADLASDPAAATLDFAIDMMGQITINLSLYPQDGAQVVALAVNAAGQQMNASLTYGEQGDQEYATFAIEIPAQNVAASINVVEAPTADGRKEGTVALDLATGEQSVNLTADLAEETKDVTFRPIANASQAYDASNMTEADTQALNAEFQNALGGLMNYLSTIEVQPAA